MISKHTIWDIRAAFDFHLLNLSGYLVFMHSSNGICHSTRKSFPAVLVSNETSDRRKHDKKLQLEQRNAKINDQFLSLVNLHTISKEPTMYNLS